MRKRFLEKGYIVVPRLLDVTAAQKEICSHFPASETDNKQDFGSDGRATFPSTPALNQITVHPIMLLIARHLLGTHNIRLVQSVAWAKYGVPTTNAQSNRDQRMHMDYGNHYWTHPPRDWYQPDAIAAIVYYSDTRKTGGDTAVVPRTGPNDTVYQWPFSHMPGIGGNEFANDRQAAEQIMAHTESNEIRQECYARELQRSVEPGSVLFYRLDTWHRGTPVRDGQVRHVHNLVWKKADADAISQWNPGFTQKMYNGDFERFISTLEPDQLSTLGFPAADDDTWKDENVCKAVQMRYGWAGFNLDKYLSSVKPPPVPEYWPFSSLTLDWSGTFEECHTKLHRAFDTIGVEAEVASSWTWTLHACFGVYYVMAECHVFRTSDGYKIDIQRLSGNQHVWFTNVHQNLKAVWHNEFVHVGESTLVVDHTDPRAYDYLKFMPIDALTSIGPDADTSRILPLLKHHDLEVVRATLWVLSKCREYPACDDDIMACSNQHGHSFLERNIRELAKVILHRRPKL